MSDDTHMRTTALGIGIGRAIRARRKAKNLTQEALADRVGMQRTSISNVEHGKQGLRIWRLLRIAEVLGCDLNDLLAGPGGGGGADSIPPGGYKLHSISIGGGGGGDGSAGGPAEAIWDIDPVTTPIYVIPSGDYSIVFNDRRLHGFQERETWEGITKYKHPELGTALVDLASQRLLKASPDILFALKEDVPDGQ